MTTPNAKVDVLGLGCAAVDDVIYVPTHPLRDSKLPVQRTTRRFGGLTGTALVAAARLGARCGYAGQLGTDDLSIAVRENFVQEGIDVSHSPCVAAARVVHSTVIVAEDDGSRSILYAGKGDIGAHATLPDADYLRACAVLLVDHYGVTGTLRAVRIARSAGVCVVADFEDDREDGFDNLLSQVNHLILSSVFAMRITTQSDAAGAALALWHAGRAAVIITCGADGCWSVDPENAGPVRHPAFAIKAVDTTGCGDVFHGAYAASLARGDSLADRIRFATAAAALHARDADIPRRADVEEFLADDPPANPL
jgi:sulfofructose kinase